MIGKSIANRPYMYLPLKGDTNDYSTNAQNPSNTGVATTTGQFGESNGAYEWDAITDRLAWSNTVGQAVATKINSATTITMFAYIRDINNDICRLLHQWDTTSTGRSWSINANDRTSDSAVDRYEYFTNLTGSGSGGSTNSSNNAVTYNQWDFLAFISKQNGSNIDKEILVNNVSVGTSTDQKAYTSSSNEMRIGALNGSAVQGNIGKLHDFRLYDVTLSDGALKILNNEKGRIRA